jgi:Arc/MetJ family transcription regulator
MMRTTINLDENLLDEVVEISGERDRGKAVNAAMREFVRRDKIRRLIALAGRVEIVDNWEEMEKIELDKTARREW